MCNISLKCCCLPAAQKRAIVTPRLKNASLDPGNLNSYRPISNLSFISRVVERVVASKFVQNAEIKKLFPVQQSAYRCHHSTETAALAVYSDITHAMDE